jgi:predicted PurR-regulated permease PerM
MTDAEPQGPATSATTDFAAVTETVVRLGVLALLVAWCIRIVLPFVGPVAWGIIIAVAVAGPFRRLERLVGGRSKLAGALFLVIALLVLIVPAVMLSETLASGAQQVAGPLSEGTIQVPPPPESVAGWPLVGDSIYQKWKLASENLALAFERIQPQLQQLGLALLSAMGSAGLGLLQFILSIIVATALLVGSETGQRFAHTLASKLAGDRGDALASLASSTVTSVATGIVGVGLIQAVLAGLGFIAVGLPAAGLWAMAVLVCAIVQLPVLLVMVAVIIYVFTTSSTTVAVMFAIWGVFVGMIDNFLKPIFFGRGAKVPTLVIFLGAIGGMLASGIIGLFTGSVILAVGYTLFRAWLDPAEGAEEIEPQHRPTPE